MAQEIVDGARAGDLAQYTEADREFHLRLLGYSGNQRLVDLVAELRGQTRLVGLASLLDRGYLVSSAREHLDLLDLMERRDAAAVEIFMVRHINHIQDLWSGKAAAGATGDHRACLPNPGRDARRSREGWARRRRRP